MLLYRWIVKLVSKRPVDGSDILLFLLEKIIRRKKKKSLSVTDISLARRRKGRRSLHTSPISAAVKLSIPLGGGGVQTKKREKKLVMKNDREE